MSDTSQGGQLWSTSEHLTKRVGTVKVKGREKKEKRETRREKKRER